MRFVLATFNRDKARELESLLALPGLELVSLADWPAAVAPVEDGDSLRANALIKAHAAMALTGLAAIADDTGLEVDALGGAPGVHTARFAGPDASYEDNVAHLLRAMAAVAPANRAARFHTMCVAVFPDRPGLEGEGRLEGRIARERRGAQGFGYDPVFELPDGRMLAELSHEEKNRISHRGLAVKALAARLREVVG